MAEYLHCPDRDAWRAFAPGRLRGAAAEPLESHLTNCDRCLELVAATDADDPLLQTLRGLKAVEVELDSGVARLIDSLKSVSPTLADRRLEDTQRAAAAAMSVVSTSQFRPGLADELTQLGEYRLLRLIGEGAMGAVFEAQYLRLHRNVAVKVIHPALAATEQSKLRFLREARAAAALEHENVVAVYHAGEQQGVLYLVMPLLAGETLAECLKREGALPFREVLRIGAEIARGLAAAHEAGLMHRDLKPANIPSPT